MSESHPTSSSTTTTTTIDPALALELRIRWLEAILVGVKPDVRDGKAKENRDGHDTKSGESLAKMVEDVQKKFNAVVEGNDGLKRFINHCTYFHS